MNIPIPNINALTGRVASIGPGAVKGPARVINSEADLDKIRPGDIMVTSQTDINYAPSMLLCAGIITETGGRFCHAAIFSRENDLPCITDVDGARELIPDGVTIVLDPKENRIAVSE